MDFINCYEDVGRADAYATLEFANTYHLAYRDLPIARALDPSGDYRIVPGDNLTEFEAESFDLIVSVFTFDNIPSAAKVWIFSDLRNLLRPAGTIVSVFSSPEIYTHEWASFTTKDFPENAAARSGDVVRIVVTDHQDRRPVDVILRTGESYREVYRDASLQAIQVFKPLANGDEPYSWVSETKIPPCDLRVETSDVAKIAETIQWRRG